jgi:hypothetical protein
MARWLVLNEDGRVHEALNLDMVDHIDFAYHARDPERLAEVTLYIRGRKPLHLSDDEHMRFVLEYVTAVPAAPAVAMPAPPQPEPAAPVEAPVVAAAEAPAQQAPPAAAPRKPRSTRRTAAAAPAQSEPAEAPAEEPRPKPRTPRRRSASAEPA